MENIFDMFFTNLLEANLKVKFFAHEIIYYTVTKSTTDDIWELYNETGQTKALIITDNQTAGRGHHNNKWISQPSKSITCSFMLKNFFKNEKASLYSILMSYLEAKSKIDSILFSRSSDLIYKSFAIKINIFLIGYIIFFLLILIIFNQSLFNLK